MADTKEQIEKRRKARRRKIRKKRLKAALIILLITAVCVFAVLCLTVLFPVKRVTASGSRLYNEKQIIKASGINEDYNIFTISKKDITDNIISNLPYIDSVDIKKELPDSIILTVTDAKEYLCYKNGDKYYAVSKNNIVLNIYDKAPEELILVNCNKAVFKIGKKLDFSDDQEKQLNDSIIKLINEKKIAVNGIDITDKFDIKLKMAGRFNISLGDRTDLENKMAHLAAMLNNIEENKTGTIDLSMWSKKDPKGTFVSRNIE